MINFSDYLNESTGKKKYIALYFTDETNKKLYEYATSQGFDLSYNYDKEKINPRNFKFHCTLFYAKNRIDIENQTYKVEPLHAKAQGLTLFGKNKDVLVLRLNNGFSQFRMKYLDMGMKDTFSKWRPHISVCYKYDKQKDVAATANLPEFDLVASHITIEDQL